MYVSKSESMYNSSSSAICFVLWRLCNSPVLDPPIGKVSRKQKGREFWPTAHSFWHTFNLNCYVETLNFVVLFTVAHRAVFLKVVNSLKSNCNLGPSHTHPPFQVSEVYKHYEGVGSLHLAMLKILNGKGLQLHA